MKEIKTFFGKDNKLNKGYVKTINVRENDSVFYQKKFAHILPPIDVINEFENIHPGTLARLMDMAEKEQNHRQALDLVNLDSQARAFKMGRYFTLMSIVAACVTTIALVVIASAYIGIVFSIVAFLAISVISLFPMKKNHKKAEFEQSSPKNHNFVRRKNKR